MELTKKQQAHLLASVAEGLKTNEINKRAASFKPPYQVSRQQVDFYRDSRGVKLKEIADSAESEALKAGFALRDERVRVLSEMGTSLYQDLKACLRSLADGEFKEGEIRQLRGIFDDLAKEMGDRKTKIDAQVEQTGEMVIRVEYE